MILKKLLSVQPLEEKPINLASQAILSKESRFTGSFLSLKERLPQGCVGVHVVCVSLYVNVFMFVFTWVLWTGILLNLKIYTQPFWLGDTG